MIKPPSFVQPLLSLLAAGSAIAASVLSATSAQAFTLTFAPQFGSTENTGATADVAFTFSDLGSDVQLDLNIFNTTNQTPGAQQATLMGIAFNLIGEVSISSFTGSDIFGNLLLNPTLAPYGSFDVGIAKNNDLQGGNPRGALTEGNSTSVSLIFDTALTATEVESEFLVGFSEATLGAVARFQEVGVDGDRSDSVLGGTSNSLSPGSDPNAGAVPESSTILGALVAVALGRSILGKRRS